MNVTVLFVAMMVMFGITYIGLIVMEYRRKVLTESMENIQEAITKMVEEHQVEEAKDESTERQVVEDNRV